MAKGKSYMLWVGPCNEFATACTDMLEKLTKCTVCRFFDDIQVLNATVEWHVVKALIIHVVTTSKVTMIDDIVRAIDWVRDLEYFSGKLFILTNSGEDVMKEVSDRLKKLLLHFHPILPDNITPSQLIIFIAAEFHPTQPT